MTSSQKRVHLPLGKTLHESWLAVEAILGGAHAGTEEHSDVYLLGLLCARLAVTAALLVIAMLAWKTHTKEAYAIIGLVAGYWLR